MAVQHPVDNSNSSMSRRRKLWWIAGSGLLALLVIVLLVANVWASQRAESADVAATPTTSSPTSSASRTAAPTPSPTISSSPTNSPLPTAPVLPEASTPDPSAGIGVPSNELAPPPVQEPVALEEPAAAVPGVVFTIGELEAVDGEARGPGEVAGPSLRFAVSIRNDTAAPVSLTSTVVNFYYGVDQAPATELAAPGGVPLPSDVAAGGTARGVFLFNVPEDGRDLVQIAVDYSAGVPIVLFEGPAPR